MSRNPYSVKGLTVHHGAKTLVAMPRPSHMSQHDVVGVVGVCM